jgi:hypothetical protein
MLLEFMSESLIRESEIARLWSPKIVLALAELNSFSYTPGPRFSKFLIFESLQFGTLDKKIALRP